MEAALLPSLWQDLPPDLLELLLLRLPSHADRVRFHAVCRPWRAGARRLQPRLPPPLPWLAVEDDGTLVDLDGNPIRCAPILSEGVGAYVAVDNLALLVHDDGGCSLMNPLSGQPPSSAITPLPKLADIVRQHTYEVRQHTYEDDNELSTVENVYRQYVKVILSSPLHSSPDPIVAAIIAEKDYVAIATCKRHYAVNIRFRSDIDDIAFLHGKLYALSGSRQGQEGLHVLELDAGCPGEPPSFLSSGFHQCIADNPELEAVYDNLEPDQHGVVRYLSESNGRLIMVRRWMTFEPKSLGVTDRTYMFECFEADLSTIPGRWVKVDRLGGQAIFLGSRCSKSVRASQCVGGVREDCIYFMHMFYENPSTPFYGPNPLGDSGVYSMIDGRITPLIPEATMAKMMESENYRFKFLTWFFPADV